MTKKQASKEPEDNRDIFEIAGDMLSHSALGGLLGYAGGMGVSKLTRGMAKKARGRNLNDIENTHADKVAKAGALGAAAPSAVLGGYVGKTDGTKKFSDRYLK